MTSFISWRHSCCSSFLSSISLSLLLGGDEVDGWASRDFLDWGLTLNESTLLWKWGAVGLVDIVPVAGDWVLGNWVNALDWWSVLELELGSIEVVWTLGVIVAWVGIRGDLAWSASGDRWPAFTDLNSGAIHTPEGDIAGVDLKLGSIEVVWTLGVVITWVGIRGNLTWSASSDRWPLDIELNLGSIEVMGALGVVVAWVVVGGDLSWGTTGD